MTGHSGPAWLVMMLVDVGTVIDHRLTGVAFFRRIIMWRTFLFSCHA